MKKWLIGLLALWPAMASGQVVFFDDFEGSTLLPHWSQPRPSDWEYDVSNGMLNVTGLFFPSVPKQNANYAFLTAAIPDQTDFRVDARMGWEAGQGPHSILLDVLNSNGVFIASFGYSLAGEPGSAPQIFAGTGTQGLRAPAPPPGLYDFSIVRSGNRVSFFLNDDLFGSLADGFQLPAAQIVFDFTGPYPGELGALHVDRVRVVPSSCSLLAFSCFFSCSIRRCRRGVLLGC